MVAGGPLIGITTYGPDVLAPGSLPMFSLPQAYSDAVSSAGGIPVLLAPSAASAEALLARVDGLVIAGGGDIDPATHGADEHETVYMVNSFRDKFELAVTTCALARGDLPVLGICRGMQLLNIALGGDLEIHLPDVYGDEVTHRLPPREPTYHSVRIEPGSVLEEIYAQTELRVCSWHHQCVRELGRDLRPVAWSSDGVVEALVYEAAPWVVGVQWHPEMQVAVDPLQRRLFDAFVRSVGRG